MVSCARDALSEAGGPSRDRGRTRPGAQRRACGRAMRRGAGARAAAQMPSHAGGQALREMQRVGFGIGEALRAACGTARTRSGARAGCARIACKAERVQSLQHFMRCMRCMRRDVGQQHALPRRHASGGRRRVNRRDRRVPRSVVASRRPSGGLRARVPRPRYGCFVRAEPQRCIARGARHCHVASSVIGKAKGCAARKRAADTSQADRAYAMCVGARSRNVCSSARRARIAKCAAARPTHRYVYRIRPAERWQSRRCACLRSVWHDRPCQAEHETRAVVDCRRATRSCG